MLLIAILFAVMIASISCETDFQNQFTYQYKIAINGIQGPKVKIISKSSTIFLKNAFGIKLKYLETSELHCPGEKL